MHEQPQQSPEFVDLEEEEMEPRVPSPISNPARRTTEIDPIQKEIYDYIKSLERIVTGKIISSSSNQEENEGIHSNILGELQVEDTLKQEIYELEILNRHLKRDNEIIKAHNEIKRTQNDNVLIHLGF